MRPMSVALGLRCRSKCRRSSGSLGAGEGGPKIRESVAPVPAACGRSVDGTPRGSRGGSLHIAATARPIPPCYYHKSRLSALESACGFVGFSAFRHWSACSRFSLRHQQESR